MQALLRPLKNRFLPFKTPLSPIDIAFSGHHGYPVEFLFEFNYELDADLLQDSLKKSLKNFPVLKSRMIEDKNYGYILKGNHPVDFQILPPIKAPIDSFSSQSLSYFHTAITSLPNENLVKIRYAKTPSGSALAVNISHCLVDGYSYFNFIAYWAKSFQSKNFNLKNKVALRLFSMDMDRRKLCSSHFPLNALDHPGSQRSEIKNLSKEDILRLSGIAWCGKRPSCEFKDIEWEFIDFKEEEISDLQKKASVDAKLRVSKHDVLTAHLWQSLAHKWNPDSEFLSCSSALDYRRILPTLSPLYFGNAIRPATITERKEIILNSSLGKLADLVRTSTSRIQKTEVYESLKSLDQLRIENSLRALEEMHVSDPLSGLLVTNLTRFKPDLFNFGSGGPRKVIPLTPAARSVVLLKSDKGILARIQKQNGTYPI